MIGKVTGRMEFRGKDHVLIDTGGIGYVVYCSERTLAMMPASGGMVSLYTEMVVRQDLIQLFGFSTIVEREWHNLLTSVQGVGSKAALAIVGTLGTDGAARAITLGDVTAIKAAPGVGPKLAQRITMELKDKAPAIMALGSDGAKPAVADEDMVIEPVKAKPAAAVVDTSATAQADALSALVNLGYGTSDAATAVAEASGNAPEATPSDLIRLALRLLAPKG